jgi:hypothetical protein
VAGRWTNESLPEPLQQAVFLLYINAGLSLLGLGGLGLPLIVAFVAGGYGVANEKKWGYQVALVASVLALVLDVYALLIWGRFFGVVNVFFAGLLVYLLVRPVCREYQRIWFR